MEKLLEIYEIKKVFIINLLFYTLIGVLIIAGFYLGIKLLFPFILAFLISFILRTPSLWLSEKLKLSPKITTIFLIIIFYSFLGIILFFSSIKLSQTFINYVASLPNIFATKIEPLFNNLFNQIEELLNSLDKNTLNTLNTLFVDFTSKIGNLISNLSITIIDIVTRYVSSFPKLFIKTLITIIATFFISLDYENITNFIIRQFSEKRKNMIFTIKNHFLKTLFICIRSYGIIMIITFIELSLGFFILGIKNGMIIALAITIFDILPFLATGGILIPWAIFSFIQKNYFLGIGLIILYLIITTIRNIIEPKLVGLQIGLHPILTLSSMFVGAELFGIIGLFSFPILLSLISQLNKNNIIKIYKL